MAQAYLAGIDIGTTGAKAVLCDSRGQIVAQGGEEYPTSFPHPNWAEQQPADWWAATCRIMQRLFRDSGISPPPGAMNISPPSISAMRTGHSSAPQRRRSPTPCW